MNKISDITNFDEVILSESNYDLAIVALNEIALKEIDVQIILVKTKKECQLIYPLVIKSNLMNSIKTLETLRLHLTHDEEISTEFKFL